MTIYDQMLAAYPQQNDQQIHNARIEVAQQIVLAGLARSDFFSKAAFYGGTCLRIFHGLQRFSEDMDFSLLQTDSSFSWEAYFPVIEQEFQALGRTVTITRKDKKSFGKVVKADPETYVKRLSCRSSCGRHSAPSALYCSPSGSCRSP